jgi:hypothetical protein
MWKSTKRDLVQKGTLPNGTVTKWYMLQNGTLLHNGTRYKTVHCLKGLSHQIINASK